SITLVAPHQGCTPVILLLNQPKTKRQRRVSTTEISRPCFGESTKKYGLKGTKPPATYDRPMFNADFVALLGSGLSKPNSYFIMNSTHCFLSFVISSVALSWSSALSPIFLKNSFVSSISR